MTVAARTPRGRLLRAALAFADALEHRIRTNERGDEVPDGPVQRKLSRELEDAALAFAAARAAETSVAADAPRLLRFVELAEDFNGPPGCPERADDGGEARHCLHAHNAGKADQVDLVCCWCGYEFAGATIPEEHGENAMASP